MLMDVPPHSNSPKISSHHVDSMADSLMTFPLWNSKIIIFVNFLRTTMVGITKYLNLTAFQRMLFSFRMKLGSGLL